MRIAVLILNKNAIWLTNQSQREITDILVLILNKNAIWQRPTGKGMNYVSGFDP